MNEDTMEDIIRDAHALAQWTGEADLIRSGAETIARRLERLVEHGLFITPKAALDAVAGERPLDKMLKTPMREGVEKRSWLELPRGITLLRLRNTGRKTTFVGQYNDTANSGNTNPLRVYMIECRPVHPDADPGTPRGKVFFVDVTEDGKILFSISTERGRAIAERLGVKALKAWLCFLVGSKRSGKMSRKNHDKRNRANRRARKAAAGKSE